jgi:hypothetical protein
MMDALERVLMHPRSVPARRALALQWQQSGDPRFDLIDRQLREHDGLGILSRETVLDEIDDLIQRNGRQWAGEIAELTNSYSYELGLVASINIDGDRFVEQASELISVAPILHVAIDPPIDLAAIAGLPELTQLSTLSVLAGPWLNDESVVAFAASPNIRGLRVIDFQGGKIGERGFQALSTSPHLKNIVYVKLAGNPCASLATNVDDRAYLVGEAGLPYLREAYEAAAMSDTGTVHEWPPRRGKLAYDDEDVEKA